MAGFGALLLFSGLPAHAQTVVEVIPLKHRSAEQIIPILRPMLDREGSISGIQNQRVVRTSAGNLAQLRQILATLDTQPRRLLITVRQDAAAHSEQRIAELSGRVSSGRAAVVVPGPGQSTFRGEDGVRAKLSETASTRDDGVNQTLQVLEGSSAFIQTGQSIPVPQRQVTRTVINGQVVEQVTRGADYRDIATGFYAQARISGDQVTLDISPQRESPARPEQNLPRVSVNVQQLTTTVSGRLGEWLEIGGTTQHGTTEQSALLGRSSSAMSDTRRVLLKVEEMR